MSADGGASSPPARGDRWSPILAEKRPPRAPSGTEGGKAGVSVAIVSRRERGEGFFNRPRDACAMAAMMVMETDHETASYARDYRWCRVIDCGALLAAMVAQEWPLSLDSAEARTGRPHTATRIAGVRLRVHRWASAAQFSERRCSATIRAIPSTLERIDTAPPISRHLPAAATTCRLGVTRHPTTTASVRGIQLPMSDRQTIPRSRGEAAALTRVARSPTRSGSHRRCRSRAPRPRALRRNAGSSR